MARAATKDPAPPFEVLVEFLNSLQETVMPEDRIVPVLRGSTLLWHWFGKSARPAADIDLEWFHQPGPGSPGRSPMDQALRLCGYAVQNHWDSPIRFDPDIPVPSDGVSLWEYETPGVRCYTGWTWNERNLSGILQIDNAQANSYDIASVAPKNVNLLRPGEEPARIPAYSQEMLLAAKISWIVRSFKNQTPPDGNLASAFLGEAKDLFDAHLLLTQANLHPEVLRSALLIVAVEDKLDWNTLENLLNQGPESSTEYLPTISARLRPLIDDIWPHLPFLRSILVDPIDEANVLIYADWLEDRADPRADFLRNFNRFFFRKDRSVRFLLASALPKLSAGWLTYVFGGSERLRDLRKQIEPF